MPQAEPGAHGAAHRRPAGRPSAAPLVCWLWALAFVSVAGPVFDHASRSAEVPPSAAFRDFNLPRVEAFASSRRDTGLRVVTLGNSRLRYATFRNTGMADLSRRMGTGDMAFLRLTNHWAVFEDFQILADELLAADPDVIVLQLELLGIEPSDRKRRIVLGNYLAWQLFGAGAWNPLHYDQRNAQFLLVCKNIRNDLNYTGRIRRRGDWMSDREFGRSAKLARDFVLQAAARGIRVLLVTIPKTPRMEAALPSDRKALLEAAAALQHESDNIVLLRYPREIPVERYCDFEHLNAAGRELYSAWLIEQVGVAVAGSPQAAR